MFVDEVEILLRAGKGGDGCSSFRRERHRPKGGPDGGNGGRGGDIILECDENVADLAEFKFKPHASAGNGSNGMGGDRNGRNGADRILKIPPGTEAFEVTSGSLRAELLEHQQKTPLLRGGKGGRGNLHFKNSVNQAPRRSTPGEAGCEGRYRLVLKTIADIGLVGYPNAGKSSLTNLLTHTECKIAAYPFTTLNSHVGVIEYEEEFDRLFLADIPGLVEGAHQNRGLGHRFLRHIERCSILLIVIDMSGTEGRVPKEDFRNLIAELELFQPGLGSNLRLIVSNKMDLSSANENLECFLPECDLPVLPISCATGMGIGKLKEVLYQEVRGRKV